MAAYPAQFIAALVVIIACISYGAYSLKSYCSNVLQPPVTLNDDITWVWTEPLVDKPPIHFKDAMRKAQLIIEQTESRLGTHHVATLMNQQKLAKYLFSFGYWNDAIRYLSDARRGYTANYGERDPNLPDIDTLIGDCYLQLKDYPNAVRYYSLALKEYKILNCGDNSLTIARLKCAIAQLHSNNIVGAKNNFSKQLGRPYSKGLQSGDFGEGMATVGLADCLLAELEVERRSKATNQQADLNMARDMYQTGINFWQRQHDQQAGAMNFTEHDALILLLRIADTFILQGDFQQALGCYQEVLKKQELFNEDETAAIKSNCARLLWRTNHFQEALAMDDEATKAAKDSNAVLRVKTRI